MTSQEKFGVILWFWGIGALVLNGNDGNQWVFLFSLFCAFLGTLLIGAKND